MCMGEIFAGSAGQQDDLQSAQERAREYKAKAVELGKTLEGSEKEREDATQRVAALEEELRSARAASEEELQTLRASHQRELALVRESARKEAVREYAAGYRCRYRADFFKTFNAGLLFRMFNDQARRQGLEKFTFDPNDFCGFDPHCPAYVPPPAGVFKDEGEDPLEAWDVASLASETGVLPEKKGLLPPRPVPRPVAPATTSSIHYERSAGSKRRVVCGEPATEDTPGERDDAEMADAEADATTTPATSH